MNVENKKTDLIQKTLDLLGEALSIRIENFYTEIGGKWEFISNLIVLADPDDGYDKVRDAIDEKIRFTDAIQFADMDFEPVRIKIDQNGSIAVHFLMYVEDHGEAIELVYRDSAVSLETPDQLMSMSEEELEAQLDAIRVNLISS